MGIAQGESLFDAPSVGTVITETRRKIHAEDFSADFSAALYPPTSPGLTLDLPAFHAYINGVRVTFPAQTVTLIANKDNYIDIGQDGTIDVNPVTLNAAAPTLQPLHMRIFLAITGASSVAGLVNLRSIVPQGSWMEGLKVEFVSNTQVRVRGGSCYIPGSQRIVHSKDKDTMSTKTVAAPLVAGRWYVVYAYEAANGYLDYIIVGDNEVNPYPTWDGSSPTARTRVADISEDYRYIGDLKAFDATRIYRFYDTVEGNFVRRKWAENIWIGGSAPLMIVNNGGALSSTIVPISPVGTPAHTAVCEVDIFAYNSNSSAFIYLAEQVPNFAHSATEFQSMVTPLQTMVDRFAVTPPTPFSIRYFINGAGAGSYISVAGYGYER